MINAVLVFNNNGQPRLTKFYSQLVCVHPARPVFQVIPTILSLMRCFYLPHCYPIKNIKYQ